MAKQNNNNNKKQQNTLRTFFPADCMQPSSKTAQADKLIRNLREDVTAKAKLAGHRETGNLSEHASWVFSRAKKKYNKNNNNNKNTREKQSTKQQEEEGGGGVEVKRMVSRK